MELPPEIKPGSLYRLIDQTLRIRRRDRSIATISFGPAFFDGPLMYVCQVEVGVYEKHALFLNANGVRLQIASRALVEAVKTQSIVRADS